MVSWIVLSHLFEIWLSVKPYANQTLMTNFWSSKVEQKVLVRSAPDASDPWPFVSRLIVSPTACFPGDIGQFPEKVWKRVVFKRELHITRIIPHLLSHSISECQQSPLHSHHFRLDAKGWTPYWVLIVNCHLRTWPKFEFPSVTSPFGTFIQLSLEYQKE